MTKQDDFDKYFPARHMNILLLIFSITIIASLLSFVFLDDSVFSSLKKEPILIHKTYRAFPLLGKTLAPLWLLSLWFVTTSRIKGITISIIALLLVAIGISTIKPIVRRPRPRDILKQELSNDENENVVFRSWSFPSGDTASIFAVATAISSFVGWYWRPVIFSISALVGIMRITSFSHYPSDVLAGAGLGIFCAWLAVKICRKNISFDKLPLDFFNTIAIICLFLIPVLSWILQGREKFIMFIYSYILPSLLFYLIITIEKFVKNTDLIESEVS